MLADEKVNTAFISPNHFHFEAAMDSRIPLKLIGADDQLPIIRMWMFT